MDDKTTRADRTRGRIDIERQVADRLKRTQEEVSEVVLAFLNELASELAQGRRVEIRNFGRFEVRERKPRVAKNPHTGEPVQVPACNAVNFRAGRALVGIVQVTEVA